MSEYVSVSEPEVRCKVCHKRLLSKEWYERGIGPSCFKKSPEEQQRLLEKQGQLRLFKDTEGEKKMEQDKSFDEQLFALVGLVRKEQSREASLTATKLQEALFWWREHEAQKKPKQVEAAPL